jgi:hypothetical protein
MRLLAIALRPITRVLLWLTIAFPVAWVTLWLSERLLHAGVFGFELVMSGWFWAAWIVGAVVVGNAAAYGCDRSRRRVWTSPVPRWLDGRARTVFGARGSAHPRRWSRAG